MLAALKDVVMLMDNGLRQPSPDAVNSMKAAYAVSLLHRVGGNGRPVSVSVSRSSFAGAIATNLATSPSTVTLFATESPATEPLFMAT